MADLRAVEDLQPQRTLNTYQGVMVRQGSGLAVNVNGGVLKALWADPLSVREGDRVLVDISSSRAGGGAAFVRSRLAGAPRPPTGTVATVPAGSPTITVTGSDGIVYTATITASYTPVVGDNVVLDWASSQPNVTGKVTSTAPVIPPPTAVAPPPASSTTGSTPFPAADADTLWPAGGWGTWAGGGGRVYQGSYGSGPVYGAWFYNGATAQLAGKTITRIQFMLGPRRPVGSNNSPVTVHLYAHTSGSKPSGDVARTVGPFDVTAQPGQGLTSYDLDLSFASVLQQGGGIAIAGEPYAGFQGVREHPESGLLIIDWRA